MKFCYIDESGTGSEPIAVMAGVVADSYSMRKTKVHWADLLHQLSVIINREIKEIHTRDFYSGNSPWRELTGDQRSRIIDAIFNWLNERKHDIVYTAVQKDIYFSKKEDDKIKEVGSLWRFMALHLSLSLQKKYQGASRGGKRKIEPKGSCVLIFDNEEKESSHYKDILLSPPDWTDTYYDKKINQEKMDKIVDVPHFVDSQHVGLIQLADFVCFFLRRYVELSMELAQPRYANEKEKVDEWVMLILKRAIPKSNIFLNKGRCECSDLFFQCAIDIEKYF